VDGAFHHRQPTESLQVRVRLLDLDDHVVHDELHDLIWFVIEDERGVSGWEPGSRLFHRHVPTPTAGSTATGSTRPSSTWSRPGAQPDARAGPLSRPPRPRRLDVGRDLRLVIGSCYDAYTDPHSRVADAYTALVPARLGGETDTDRGPGPAAAVAPGVVG
jgi:hypothetical protein